jgi:hypothetical protein
VTTVGDANGFPIWVPDDTTVLTPLRTPFVSLANSVNTQLGHLKAQSTSVIAKSNVCSSATGWDMTAQNVTVVGEVLVFVNLTFTRHSGASTINAGNIVNQQLGQMDATYNATQPVPLAAGATGNNVTGYIDTAGKVWLASTSSNIAAGNGISLGGSYPLTAPIASGL